MKIGDVVRTLYEVAPQGRLPPFTGIITKRVEMSGAMRTARITVLTAAGDLIVIRASYNLLEVINESR